MAADILADVRHIAAGTEPAGGVGPEAALSDTRNVEALKDLRNLGQLRYLAGDIPGTPTGSSSSLTNHLISLVGLIGQDVRATERAFEQQGVALAGLQDRRDSVSGVSIDEEVTSLIHLQASFQANARVISTVNQLFDDLLAAF